MIRLPAARPRRPAPEPTVVLASRLELVRYRDVPRFLVDAVRLRRLFRHADGAVVLALGAEPSAKTFWTYSQWSDDATMRRYVRDPLHAAVMTRYADRMAGSTFSTGAFDPKVPADPVSTWRALVAGDRPG